MMKRFTTRAAQPGAGRTRWLMLTAAAMLAATIFFLRIASGQTAPESSDSAAAAETTTATTPAATESDSAPVKRFTRNDALVASLTIFVLAVFVGFEVIAKVPPTLHTPLMSGSNAVSGITIVGSLLVTGHGHWFISLIGMFAVVLAMVNVVGGFVVTHRMLGMFRRK
jgi:NAD(P) transhydrogenase subunit alpha